MSNYEKSNRDNMSQEAGFFGNDAPEVTPKEKEPTYIIDILVEFGDAGEHEGDEQGIHGTITTYSRADR